MSNKAERIADTLLETFEKWDNAFKTYKELRALKLKSMDLFDQTGRSIAYHRALAKAGVRKEDVARVIHGGQIGATHNYKGMQDKKLCPQCRLRSQASSAVECSECGGPLEIREVPVPLSELRSKYAHHEVGVELKDGRYVWFDRMVPRNPWAD